MVSRIRIGECESRWFYYIERPSPPRGLKSVGIAKLTWVMMAQWVQLGNGSLAVVIAERVPLVPLPAVRVSGLRCCDSHGWRNAESMRFRAVCPLIESALWQVGRQTDVHVSKGEGIVTTRPCDGNNHWGDDDSIMVAKPR